MDGWKRGWVSEWVVGGRLEGCVLLSGWVGRIMCGYVSD